MSKLPTTAFDFPKYTYKCYLFGSDDFGIVWQVAKPPNWFWRWMQYLCFGNRWERIK